MSTTSYSTNGSRPTSRQHDTGFPDSFASRTTSMRHPDAIIDPGFAISSEHIDPAKTLQRSRKSLLRKHRRTISFGKISEGSFSLIDPEKDTSGANSTADLVNQESSNASVSTAQPSKPVAESSSRAGGSESILGLSPGFHYTYDGSPDDDERRRTNIFRKLTRKN
ncbi:hypothetical protein F4777DRAFT_577266 [Nemania sp. FL0916]|nr:hypothetical protein F4777DRAFT_577266 [Nemania sp. FL0916]